MVPNRAKHHIVSGMVHTLQLTSLKQFFAHLWTWIKIQKSKNLVLEVTKGNSGEYSGLRKNTLREKIPKYRVFFWSFFSRIQSKCVKIRTRKNSVFGHFTQWKIYLSVSNEAYPPGNHVFKFKNGNMCVICLKLSVNIPERCPFRTLSKHWKKLGLGRSSFFFYHHLPSPSSYFVA